MFSKITYFGKNGRKTLPCRTVDRWEHNIKMNLEVGCGNEESISLGDGASGGF
jgi:hypothetical protein